MFIDVDNGAGGWDAYFYTGGSGDEPSWSALGTNPQTVAGGGAIYQANSQAIHLLSRGNGALDLWEAGKIWEFRLYEGNIFTGTPTPTLKQNMNAADYHSGTTFDSSTTGETWTLHGGLTPGP
jgi:hypothetical protein